VMTSMGLVARKGSFDSGGKAASAQDDTQNLVPNQGVVDSTLA